MRRSMKLLSIRRLANTFAALASLELVLMVTTSAGPSVALAQEPQLSCTAPNPAQRPPAAKKQFMIVVDSSASMTTAVPGASPSCGYRTGGYGTYSTRNDHARCAVKAIVEQFSGTVDFGIAQFATRVVSSNPLCYQGWAAACYSPWDRSAPSACCGPRSGDATTRAGARILSPVDTSPALVQEWVDNSCLLGREVDQNGNTPLNGALRDMKRYFQDHWAAPDSSVSYPTPLAGNSCAGRSVNVLLLTDGVETCDTQQDAVSAAQDLYVNGVTVDGQNYKVKTYVVSIGGLSPTNANQIAAAGGTVASYSASNEAQLLAALAEIMAIPADTNNDGVDNDCNGCVDDGWANLSITEQAPASPAVAVPGQAVTFTFEARNDGPTNADARVRLARVWTPAAFVMPLSFAGPAGWTCVDDTCTKAEFAVGEIATFTVTATIDQAAIDGATPGVTLVIEPIQYVSDPGAADNEAASYVTVVVKTTPVINWPAPGAIPYGTALGDAQLNATADTEGSFAYAPPAGTILPVGVHALRVDFTPSNLERYNPASASVSVTVEKATAAVMLGDLLQIYNGSPLTPTATTDPPGLAVVWSGAPAVDAGEYRVTATVDDPNYAGTASGTFLIVKAPAAVVLSDLLQTYTGSPLTPTATTNPVGLAIDWAGAPATNAGEYPVTARITDPNYTGSASGTFVIAKAPATVMLDNLLQTYTGSSLTPIATTNPVGLAIAWAGAPATNAGEYPVTATVRDRNYAGTASGTFVIAKAPVTVTLGNLLQSYTGSPLTPTATTDPVGLVIVWTGAPATNAGSYPVTATVDNPNFAGTASATFVIAKAPATVMMANLLQTYTGSPLTPTATTDPAGLPIVWTGAPAVNAGDYPVTAAIDHPNYMGAASGSFVIARAPSGLTWPSPAAIPLGTALGGAQLNAAANVPGSFVYEPPAGTVLSLGTHALGVAFTPNDITNYLPASAGVTIDVIFAFCRLDDPNQAKQAGSAIPIKIQLCDANGRPIPAAGLVVAARSVISGTTGAVLPPLSSGGANPGGIFRFVADGYLFNLQTTPDMAGSYVLTITVGTEPRLYSLPFLVRPR